MLETIQQKNWPKLDRRAWSVGLSLLFFMLSLMVVSFFYGRNWTFQTGLEYVPKEISIKAYDIANDLMEFSLGLPNYAFGEYFILKDVLPPNWVYQVALLFFIPAFALLAAGISYFSSTWFYGCLLALAMGAALFMPEALQPFGLGEKWVSALAVFLVCGPVYLIQSWLSSWNLARRWWVLLLIYALLFFSFSGIPKDPPTLYLISAQMWYPLLLASIAFMILNATDVLQGVLILVTREEHSKQSWLHFTVFSALYLSNYILIYLKNTGYFVLDIVYFNPFVLQILTLLAGFWLLPKKQELAEDDSLHNVGISTVYLALALLLILTFGLAFATANDLMIEVLEDGISLIHFCMGVVFFLYVFINFFQLMMLGLRVHLVLFKPRYMPVSSIPVFGLAGVWLFLVNNGYFQFYQTLAAKDVMLGDQARQSGQAFLAENYFQQALSNGARSQRCYLSLAALHYANGNPAKAKEWAESSLERGQNKEAILMAAQVYRLRKAQLYELIQLQEGVKQFPEDGQLLNNLGMAFTETIYKDSAQHYLSKAFQRADGKQAASANLAFYYLTTKLESEGLPKKNPETDLTSDWAMQNNALVFANIAREKSPIAEDLPDKFSKIPSELQPFFLYHSYLNKAIVKDSSQFSKLRALETDTIKQYYNEALSLGQAMLKYRTGLTKTGLERLQRLYQSSTSNRLDLTLLLGQVYYEQGAYTSAAEMFRKAANMGMGKANYWYALASLDGGRRNLAIDAFTEALPSLSTNDRIRITILIDGLKSGQFSNATYRSDLEKSAYVKVNWNNLSDQQVISLIALTGDNESQYFLWNYAFERAYRESMKSRCQALIQYAGKAHSSKTKWRSLIQSDKGKLFELTGNTSSLKTWLESAGPENQDYNFLWGRFHQLNRDTAKASDFYLKAIEQNPLNIRQMGACLSFFSNQKTYKSLAYEKALELSDLDPGNVEFLKLYALFAIREGLPDFAFATLPRIEVLTSKQVADQFRSILNQELAAKGYPTPLSY